MKRPTANASPASGSQTGGGIAPWRQQALRAFALQAPAFGLPLAVVVGTCISRPAAIVIACGAWLALASLWLHHRPVLARRAGLAGLWMMCMTLACLVDGPVSVTGLQWCALVPAVAASLGGPRSALRWTMAVTAGALLLGQAGEGLQTLLQHGEPAPAWFVGLLQGLFVAAMGTFALACQRGASTAATDPPRAWLRR